MPRMSLMGITQDVEGAARKKSLETQILKRRKKADCYFWQIYSLSVSHNIQYPKKLGVVRPWSNGVEPSLFTTSYILLATPWRRIEAKQKLLKSKSGSSQHHVKNFGLFLQRHFLLSRRWGGSKNKKTCQNLNRSLRTTQHTINTTDAFNFLLMWCVLE